MVGNSIFVRVFSTGDFEVFWKDGNGIIEIANLEEQSSGEPIAEYLVQHNVSNYVREMYSPWGEFEGTSVVRRLTLHEAVHYLGRRARICAFLRPRGQAVKFIEGLRKGKSSLEQNVAAEIEPFMDSFEEEQLGISRSAVYRMMESQLLNITAN
ncbi:hypothetical protein FACS1894189_8960 [Planctomycetales bacterium]|nr:hypothetical protein FACS1894189_8960 [Planctomycetales bacterium]